MGDDNQGAAAADAGADELARIEAVTQRAVQPPTWRKWVGRLLPWVAATVATVAILWKYPPARIAAEMQKGAFLPMAPYAFALVIGGIVVLSASDHAVVAGVADAPGLRKPAYLVVARARAGMSLLGLIGYGAGIGGLGVWVARVTGCTVGIASGAVLYLVSADLIAVSLVASLSIWLGTVDVPVGLRVGAPVLAGVLLLLKLGVLHGLLDRSKLPAVFQPWARISRGRAVWAVALRTVNIGWLTACSWGAARAFGLDVPLWAWAAIFPLVLLIGSMPINVAGFGAVQGAWLLFTPWAESGEQVLAYSLLWQLWCLIAISARGVPFVGSVFAEIARGKAEQALAPQ